jgi:hypothetical protein
MEKYRPGASLFKPAMYRICILGTLDKNWSNYCGGMTIENESDLNHDPMSFLTGRLADQSALIGVLNSLHDIGGVVLISVLRYDFAHRARKAGWSVEEVAHYLGLATREGVSARQTTVPSTQGSREHIKQKLENLKG